MNQRSIEIKHCHSKKDYSHAAELILEYVNWLGIDLSFQNFDKEMESLHEMYGPEFGGMLIAFVDDKAMGVAGLRKFGENDGEIKRMFVKPEARGLKIGQLLMDECISIAKKLKYTSIKLDTADFMTAAIKLYKSNGFVEIPAYRHNPHKEALYFELVLQ